MNDLPDFFIHDEFVGVNLGIGKVSVGSDFIEYFKAKHKDRKVVPPREYGTPLEGMQLFRAQFLERLIRELGTQPAIYICHSDIYAWFPECNWNRVARVLSDLGCVNSGTDTRTADGKKYRITTRNLQHLRNRIETIKIKQAFSISKKKEKAV